MALLYFHFNYFLLIGFNLIFCLTSKIVTETQNYSNTFQHFIFPFVLLLESKLISVTRLSVWLGPFFPTIRWILQSKSTFSWFLLHLRANWKKCCLNTEQKKSLKTFIFHYLTYFYSYWLLLYSVVPYCRFIWPCTFNIIQWAPLNGITDNRINRLMGSNLSRMTSPKLLFHT